MHSAILKPNHPEHLDSLSPLGLRANLFHQAGERILQAYLSATKNDAKIAAGMYAYLGGVRAVRDILLPHGWEAKVEGSIELVTNKSRCMDILVSSGNRFIGCEDGPPGNKNPKGKNTQKIIYENARQLPLFPVAKNKDQGSKSMTYFLFYHFDLNKKEMRMELSLPTHFNIFERKVSGWTKRIFLDSIDFHSTEIKDMNFDSEIYMPEIEFEVKRKQNEF